MGGIQDPWKCLEALQQGLSLFFAILSGRTETEQNFEYLCVAETTQPAIKKALAQPVPSSTSPVLPLRFVHLNPDQPDNSWLKSWLASLGLALPLVFCMS